jgi:hypothetical protein
MYSSVLSKLNEMDALSSVKDTLDAQIKEQVSWKILGQKVGIFTALDRSQHTHIYDFIEPTITRFDPLSG